MTGFLLPASLGLATGPRRPDTARGAKWGQVTARLFVEHLSFAHERAESRREARRLNISKDRGVGSSEVSRSEGVANPTRSLGVDPSMSAVMPASVVRIMPKASTHRKRGSPKSL